MKRESFNEYLNEKTQQKEIKMTPIKCIKDVFTDNSQYLNHFDVEEAMSYPIFKLFTKDKTYNVSIIGDEWRTKDDSCNDEEIPFNHIVFKQNDDELKEWFFEHFVII